MPTSATEFQAKVDKTGINMDRFDGFINGDQNTDIVTDTGSVPSIAKLQAANKIAVGQAEDDADRAEAARDAVEASAGTTLVLPELLDGKYPRQLVQTFDITRGHVWATNTDSGTGSATGSIQRNAFHGAAMYKYNLNGSGFLRAEANITKLIDLSDVGFAVGDSITVAIVTRNMMPSYPENSNSYQFFQFMLAQNGGLPFTDYYNLPDGYRIHYATYSITADMLVDSASSGQIGKFLLRVGGGAYSGEIGAPMVFKGNTRAFIAYLDQQCAGGPMSTKSLVFLGHSFVEGAAASTGDKTFAAITAAEMGVPYVNLGMGSQLSGEIAARFGAIPMHIGPGDIPASGPRAIPGGSYDWDIGYYAGVSALQSFTGVAYPSGGGTPVKGTMQGMYGGNGAHGSGTYQFVRAENGSAVACPNGFDFVSDQGSMYEGDTLIMMLFQNDFAQYPEFGQENFDPTPYVDRAVAIVSKLRPRYATVRVLEDWNTPYQGSDLTNYFYKNMTGLADALEYALGDSFVRTRELAVRFGCRIAGISPSDGDKSDMAIDAVPRSLHEPNGGGDPRGGLHPNDPGHRVIAKGVVWSLRRKS